MLIFCSLDLMQHQSLEIIQAFSVVLCFPYKKCCRWSHEIRHAKRLSKAFLFPVRGNCAKRRRWQLALLWGSKNKGGGCDKFVFSKFFDLNVDEAKTVGPFMCSQVPWKKFVPFDSTTLAKSSHAHSRYVLDPLACLLLKLEAHRFSPFWFPRAVHIKYLLSGGATNSINVECGATQSRLYSRDHRTLEIWSCQLSTRCCWTRR